MKKSKLLIILSMILIIAVLSACNEKIVPYTSVIDEAAPSTPSASAEPAREPEAEPLIATHPIIGHRHMPQVLHPPRDTSEKELVEYPTLTVEANIFFETGAAIRSAILAEGGTLYFGNEDSVFYALDISTGQIIWTFSTDEAVQTRPVLTNGKIIFNAGNSLYILNSATGDSIHIITYPSDYDIRVSEDIFAFNDSHVAVSDGVAYFIALNGDLVAVDIISGEIAWTLETDMRRVAVSGVNYYNGKLYYILSPGILYAIDIQTRQILFETHMWNMPFNPMTIYDSRIYIGGRGSRFYHIDASSGYVIWRSHSRSSGTWFSGGSVIIGDNVFTGTADENHITVFDKDTGEFQRRYSVMGFVYTPPLRHGNNIVAITTNIFTAVEDHVVAPERQIPGSYAMAIDTENHTKLWIAPFDDTVLSSPAIYQNVLFFGSDSGTVYSIDLERF